MLLRNGGNGPAYIYLAFVFVYGTKFHHRVNSCSQGSSPHASWPSSPSRFPALSDRIGRKRMYLIGAVTTACSVSPISPC